MWIALHLLVALCVFNITQATEPADIASTSYAIDSSSGSTIYEDAINWSDSMLDKQKDREVALWLEDILEQIDELIRIKSPDRNEIMEALTKAIADFENLRNESHKIELNDIYDQITYIKKMILGSIEGDCSDDDLRMRLFILMKIFKPYESLYEYLIQMNHDHVHYCLGRFAKDLSRAIDHRIRPGMTMLQNIEDFKKFFESKRARHGQASSSNSFYLDPGKDDDFLVETLINYLESKSYPLSLNNGELIRTHKIRFRQQMDKFQNGPNQFCGPIKFLLFPDFLPRLNLLFGIDANMEARMDYVTHNWTTLMLICKQMRTIGHARFYQHYLARHYNVKDIEYILLDKSQTNQFSETTHSLVAHAQLVEQLLDILRELYQIPPGFIENVNVIELLDASIVNSLKCEARELASLLALRNAHLEYPNLVNYLQLQIDKQLAICMPILTREMFHSIRRIRLEHRAKITMLRHKTERLIDPSWPVREIWQLHGFRRRQIFNMGMMNYIKTNIGCRFESLADLRERIGVKLQLTCRQVHRNLSDITHRFNVIAELGADISHSMSCWMSSFALCDHYIQNQFQWNDILDQLNEIRRENANRSFMDSVIGHCARPRSS